VCIDWLFLWQNKASEQSISLYSALVTLWAAVVINWTFSKLVKSLKHWRKFFCSEAFEPLQNSNNWFIVYNQISKWKYKYNKYHQLLHTCWLLKFLQINLGREPENEWPDLKFDVFDKFFMFLNLFVSDPLSFRLTWKSTTINTTKRSQLILTNRKIKANK
jgi:hypothetical protein